MWKATIILGLAVGALALPVEKTIHEQAIRIGSVGLSFANVKGYFVPTTPATTKGVPTYEFKSTVDGAPAAETEFINFRCNHLGDFVVTPNSPLLMCRSIAFEKVDAPAADKIFFLISALNLPVTPDVNDVNLTFGKNLWKSLIVPNTGAAHSDTMTLQDGVTKTSEGSRMARIIFIPG